MVVAKSSIRPDIRYPVFGLAGYPAKIVSGASLEKSDLFFMVCTLYCTVHCTRNNLNYAGFAAINLEETNKRVKQGKCVKYLPCR
jgi:hypothetical protein